jgi:hypothetical protein
MGVMMRASPKNLETAISKEVPAVLTVFMKTIFFRADYHALTHY